jgi:hypothetical protein
MPRYQDAQVVGVDGRVYSLNHYSAIIPERYGTFA